MSSIIKKLTNPKKPYPQRLQKKKMRLFWCRVSQRERERERERFFLRLFFQDFLTFYDFSFYFAPFFHYFFFSFFIKLYIYIYSPPKKNGEHLQGNVENGGLALVYQDTLVLAAPSKRQLALVYPNTPMLAFYFFHVVRVFFFTLNFI